jgi:hypothetical protein
MGARSPVAEDKKIICGAKRKKGQGICQAPPMRGKKRCRIHGGASTGPPPGSANALKHGLYARHLSAEDQSRWDTLPVGSLDDEIRISRIQADRCVHELEKLAVAAADSSDQMELDSVTTTTDGQNKMVVATRRRKDILKRYNFLIETIRKLELARVELGGGAKSAEDMARDIGVFMKFTDNPFGPEPEDADAQ